MLELAQSFGPICEGISTGFTDGAAQIEYPEVIYVQQGQKAWFALGESKQLNESIDESVQIVEDFQDLELIERVVNGKTIQTVKDGIWFVEGPGQRSDVKNANGRTYKRKIWERIVGDPKSAAQQDVAAGGMLGHLEHPSDGRMDGREGAIATRKLNLKEDGVVWGRWEILDTPNGLILQEYTRKKVRWGVSSRGNGSVAQDGNVNEEDYQLVTFDAVMRPSTPGAYPKPVGQKDAKTKVKEGEEPPTEPQDPPPVNEDVQRCVTAVDELQEVDASTLNESEKHRFAAKLLSNLSAVDSLASSKALEAKKANEMQDWLMRKLREVHESLAEAADSEIDRIIEAVTATEDGDPDAQQVIAQLQTKVTEAAREAERLRTELEDARSKQAEAEVRAETAESERDEAEARLEAREEALESERAKLSIASETIQSLSAVDVADEKQEAVEEAIQQHPELAEHREMLEVAVDADAVALIAEGLVERLAAEPPEEPPTEPTRRRALPSVGMVVESDVGAGSRRPTTAGSPGASLAGKAVAKMAPKTN
jgi:hypothetical protein